MPVTNTIVPSLPVTLINGTTNDANPVMTDLNALMNYANANAVSFASAQARGYDLAIDTSPSANVVVATLAPNSLQSLVGTPVDKMVVRVLVANTNTGATTLNLNGNGAVSVTSASGAALTAGQLIATQIYNLTYFQAATQWRMDASVGGGGGGGTVTSVGLSAPADFTVSGSPVTSSGTLALTRNSQTANLFLASPNGASGVPSYRAIVAADVPTLNQNTTGNAATATTATTATNITGGSANQIPFQTGAGATSFAPAPTTASTFLEWNGTAFTWGSGGGGGGTVTSVSVVSANGFAGTVATPSTTPAITLSTTVTGVLYGNGTSISALTIGSGLTLTGGTLATTGGSGTVTSVGLSLPADWTVSGSPVTTSGTLTAVRASQTANLFLASPNGASGAPSYRAIVAADVPTLNQNTTGSAASFTGSLAGDVTGTQSATVVGKINGTSLAGLATGILKNTTTTGVPSIAIASDFPTLNQNTTGTAANVTGVVAPANGGTGIANNAASTLTISGNYASTFVVSGAFSYTLPGQTCDIGYLEIPQNSQSAAYTLVLADNGKHIYHPSTDTTARLWTIPANSSVSFPIGAAITFVNDSGAGTITIAITTDTLVLLGAGTTGSRTLAPNGIATAIKVGATRWVISGTNLT